MDRVNGIQSSTIRIRSNGPASLCLKTDGLLFTGMPSKDTLAEKSMKPIKLTWLKTEPSHISRDLGFVGEMVTHY
jgi:hypothetical protein